MKKTMKFFLILSVLLSFLVVLNSPSLAIESDLHGTYYQIFVRSFYDSSGDGVGDLQGIKEQLDYLEELGINGIWLMPIMESSSYHGYDVIDYYQVNSDYGSLEDFNKLTKKANQRGIDVIIDLVVTHTSTSNPWFRKATSDEESQYRNYYIWADEDTDTSQEHIWNPSDTHWSRAGGGKYYYLFSRNMPALNYDNQALREDTIDIAKFWLEQGADGFRIDAVKHAFPPEEHKKNYQWWDEFYTAIKAEDSDAYIVGEVWDGKEVVAPYFDYFDSNFNFELGESIIEGLKKGSAVDLKDDLVSIYNYYGQEIGKDYIDAPFLTNHDQNRVMSQLNNSDDKMRLAAAIYLTLPGNPFIYYGEEIGMLGEKPDQMIRVPLKWDDDENEGETAWTFSVDNLETTAIKQQQEDPASLLNYYQQLIKLRNDNPVLYNGKIEFFTVNKDILSYQRLNEDVTLRVYHNFSDDKYELKEESSQLIYSSRSGVKYDSTENKVIVPPYSSLVLKK